ncbi:MAG: hypothetical protein KY475_02680, partial [Planctomycetes bacterium]|nr:hypothetical protein [Planctomycetota bacterium]
MNPHQCAAAIILLFLASPEALARKWTDSSGNFSVEAELVDFTGEAVRLRKPDGTIIAVPFARLSKADREFLTGGSGLARRARRVLQQYCHSCHGQDGADEGGMNYVLNLKRLVDAEKVVPGEPTGSILLERMLDREMPPEDAERQPTDSDIAVIEEWIRSGAPAFEAPTDRKFLGNDDIVRYVAADVNSAPERDRPYYRYFTITHLHNGGVSDDELQTFRLALAKLLNSLSWERELVHPKPVDPAETVFRVDVRDMRWSTRHWDLIVAVYAYGVRQVSSEANLLYRALGTPVPWIRADWFAAVASRPPLYHGLLDMPDSLAGLESQLKIDLERNVRQDRAARAGFANSGISVNPRIIERHKTSDGACWISRDFSGSAGRRNFFNHPLDFEADGGEVIFSLPNGLQAYLLVNAEGQRIDQAPTSIVKDPETIDGAVTNGVSCMRCHAGGIIPKDDEVRRSVAANARVFADVLPTINALYQERGQFQELVDEDRGRFVAALQKLGITRFSSSGEPIHNTSRRFREPLDVRLASAELGLPVDQFKIELERRPSLQRVLGPLRVPNGVVHREAFEEAFGGVVDVLPGVRHHPPTAAIAAATSSAGVASSASQATGKGLLHHWRFDETKGDIARDSAGRNNVLLT